MKKLQFLRFSLTLIISFNSIRLCNAIEVQGYIIKENSDTVFGTIKLAQFKNGYILLNGFDFEPLHYQVAFKSSSDRKFRLYYPGAISGYGFIHHRDVYTFKTFSLEFNSIIAADRNRYRFLCKVYDGNLELYQDTRYFNYPSGYIRNEHIVYYDFFVYNKTGKFLKVEVNRKTRTMHDLLRHFGVDSGFIEVVPESTKMNAIKSVLAEYDQWLSIQSKKV